MKNFKRFTALALIATLALLGFSGCGVANDTAKGAVVCISVNYGDANGSGGSSSGGSSSSSGTPSASQTPAGSTPQASVTNTPAANPTDSNTPAASETPSATNPDSSAAPSETTPDNNQQASSGVPTTPAEILNYYKTAYAKIATDAKGAVNTWTNAKQEPAILEIGALSSVASNLMGTFLKESSPNTELKPADVPPAGVTTCNLAENQIAEATCKDNGSTYEIYIKVNATQDNPDVNPPAGGGIAGTLVDVVEVSSITDAAGSFVDFTDVANSYFDTSVTATIDKASGHITELYTNCPSIMSFGKVALKPLGVPSIEDAKIGLTYENRYTINY